MIRIWPALIVFAAIFGFFSGCAWQKVRQAKQEVKTVTNTVFIERRQAKVTADVGTKSEAKLEKTRTITKEVIRYVPQILPDRGYVIRNGFVRLHDSAALGDVSRLSDTPAEPDGAPSTVTDTTAIGVIAENYGQYHQCADRLTGLQTWIAEQSKTSAK